MSRKRVTKSARARALLDAGIPDDEVQRRTGLSRQGVQAAALARKPRGRPRRAAPSERLSFLVDADTAAWLRAEALRDECSLGDVLERLAHSQRNQQTIAAANLAE